MGGGEGRRGGKAGGGGERLKEVKKGQLKKVPRYNALKKGTQSETGITSKSNKNVEVERG